LVYVTLCSFLPVGSKRFKILLNFVERGFERSLELQQGHLKLLQFKKMLQTLHRFCPDSYLPLVTEVNTALNLWQIPLHIYIIQIFPEIIERGVNIGTKIIPERTTCR